MQYPTLIILLSTINLTSLIALIYTLFKLVKSRRIKRRNTVITLARLQQPLTPSNSSNPFAEATETLKKSLKENHLKIMGEFGVLGFKNLFTSMDRAATIRAKQFKELNNTIKQFKKQQAKHLNTLRTLGGIND